MTVSMLELIIAVVAWAFIHWVIRYGPHRTSSSARGGIAAPRNRVDYYSLQRLAYMGVDKGRVQGYGSLATNRI